MSVHIEWAHASEKPHLIDEKEAPDIFDGHGNGIEQGNIGLTVGEGAILEGTREELAAWLRAALALVVREG